MDFFSSPLYTYTHSKKNCHLSSVTTIISRSSSPKFSFFVTKINS